MLYQQSKVVLHRQEKEKPSIASEVVNGMYSNF